MIVRSFFVTTMMAAAAGSAWGQSPVAPPGALEQPVVAAVQAPAPPPATARPAPAPPRAPAAPAPAPAQPARRDGQPINVRVEVTITDRKPNAAPITKTVTIVAGDGLRGSIRSEGSAPGIRSTPLNVDVDPTILADNKVRMGLSLQYDVPGQSEGGSPAGSAIMQIRDSLTMILESGKPMMVAQSADPTSDRQVTVEVKATILR